MTIRFCHGCNAEVEFVEGACLLGHQPRAVTPDSPLADLRTEVDRAFVEARLEVEAALRIETPVPAVIGVGVHSAEAATTQSLSPFGAPSLTADPDLDRLEQQMPRYLGPPLGPPPPPPPERRDQPQMINSDGRVPSNADPIAQFAPPPRVDWGPERVSLFGLGRLLRSRA